MDETRRAAAAEIPVDRLTPVRAVPFRTLDDGRFELRPPRFKGFWTGWLQRWLPPHRAFVRVVLDPRGSRVWGQLDDKRTLGDVVALVAEDFTGDDRDLTARVWMYLQAMAAEGWVRFETPA